MAFGWSATIRAEDWLMCSQPKMKPFINEVLGKSSEINHGFGHGTCVFPHG